MAAAYAHYNNLAGASFKANKVRPTVPALSQENCAGALSLARREAIPTAERAADDLAAALELDRGEVLGVLEYPLVTLP